MFLFYFVFILPSFSSLFCYDRVLVCSSDWLEKCCVLDSLSFFLSHLSARITSVPHTWLIPLVFFVYRFPHPFLFSFFFFALLGFWIHPSISYGFFFFCGTRVWNWGFVLPRQVLYCLSQASSPQEIHFSSKIYQIFTCIAPMFWVYKEEKEKASWLWLQVNQDRKSFQAEGPLTEKAEWQGPTSFE